MDSDQARQIAMLFPGSHAPIVVAGDLDPVFDSNRAITDPSNQSRDVFESTFNRLDRCAATLVRILQRAE
jgi:protein-tyrosine-phosphatase